MVCARPSGALGWLGALAVGMSLMIAGCGGESGSKPGETAKPGSPISSKGSEAKGENAVVVDGSSTVFRISQAAQEAFAAKESGITVVVDNHGTGGGFSRYLQGEVDIVDASRPAKAEEEKKATEGNIPWTRFLVGYDGISLVINPKNSWAKTLSVDELKKIWAPDSKIQTWKEVNPAWPDKKIVLFSPDNDSGTFEFFTEAIVGKAKSSRGDFTASEDDNVLVQGVSRDVHALGYFGYAYYAENQGKLKAVPIIESAGKPGVGPSMQSVLDGSYQPLSRPIFIYVSSKAYERPEVRKFVEFYLTHGATLAKEVKYVPLPDKAYALNREHLAKGKKGTVFGGVAEVGVRIEDLLAREAKL